MSLAVLLDEFSSSTKLIAVVDLSNGAQISNLALAFLDLKVGEESADLSRQFAFRIVISTEKLKLDNGEHQQQAASGEFYQVDFSNEEALLSSFEGCHGVFIIALKDSTGQEQANGGNLVVTNIIKAAKSSNVQHVVWCSERETEASNILLRSGGLPFSFLLLDNASGVNMTDVAKFALKIFQQPYANMYKRVIFRPD